MTVSGVSEYPLSLGSMLPAATKVLGSDVGVPPDGFLTWSICPLPLDLSQQVGNASLVGTWADLNKNYDLRYTRTIGVGASATTETKMLTDMPVCLSNFTVKTICKCSTLWKLYKLYRISYVSVTFTVPEFTNGQRNHSLYLEWSYLPHARTAAQEDCVGMVVENTAMGNTFGWNWIYNPPDVAVACSIDGRQNCRNGWHRAQLSYNHPVTVSWRPMHAPIIQDHVNYTDSTSASSSRTRIMDLWPTKNRMVRSYLPTDIDQSVTEERQIWCGPVFRLIDADVPTAAIPTIAPTNTWYAQYGVRCTCRVTVKFKNMDATDPIFPDFVP